jgi:hypothetical protein
LKKAPSFKSGKSSQIAAVVKKANAAFKPKVPSSSSSEGFNEEGNAKKTPRPLTLEDKEEIQSNKKSSRADISPKPDVLGSSDNGKDKLNILTTFGDMQTKLGKESLRIPMGSSRKYSGSGKHSARSNRSRSH